MKKKLTKQDIEVMATELMTFLNENGCGDTHIYFNDKRIYYKSSWNREKSNFDREFVVEDNINPSDYFSSPSEHILSMSFENDLYDALNYGCDSYLEKGIKKIFNKYNVYFEQYDAWNLSVYPNDDNMEIEYTVYKEPEEPIYLSKPYEDGMPLELSILMHLWFTESKNYGEGGSIVRGGGFRFRYKGTLYFMSKQSPYQSSLSWESSKDFIRDKLKEFGATEIYFDCGLMD